jgi:hypothetical protein
MRLRFYRQKTLRPSNHASVSKQVVTNVALAVQSVLREAQGRRICSHHKEPLTSMCGGNRVTSFNYESVVERALRPIAEKTGRAVWCRYRWISTMPITDGPSLSSPRVKL